MAEQTERDPFYVGYLPLPKAIKKFIVPWLAANLVLAIGIAVVVASNHREPGDGVWDTSKPVTIEGQLISAPYPILRNAQKSYILVEQGKVGAQARLEELDTASSSSWQVTGYLIEREGRTVLEIDGGLDEPIQPAKASAVVAPVADPAQGLINEIDLGTHTLRGEIVDPKCYLGVMQPGDGKTHKVCATLCISGGIPPMLLVRNESGQTAAYLLTDSEGNAFPESHYAYIADPIEVTGQVLRDGDLLLFRADLDSIRRLE